MQLLLQSSKTLLLGLSIFPAAINAAVTTFLSFDTEENDEAIFDRAAGSFISPDANPQVGTINPSSTVGRYIRNEVITWDWCLFTTNAITDASLYLNNNNVPFTSDNNDPHLTFYMDVLTYDAPTGTQIDITIENTGLGSYPLGRHSRYTARTSVQGSWEQLVFVLLDRPDVNVANDAIDGLLISFAPGENVGGTFFIDNLIGAISDDAVTTTTSSTTTATSTSTSSTSSVGTTTTTTTTTTTELPPTTTSSTLATTSTPSTSTSPPPPDDTILLFDEFTSSNWDPNKWQPRLPLSSSQATSGTFLPNANDNYGATLLYPKDIPESQWGPRYSTQIKSTDLYMYGNYEARLRSGQANAGEGLISAFFTYRNDEIDYDGDG